jgi:hypothetical protein
VNQQFDVTHAILDALASVHPQGMRSDVLAVVVSCEEAALHKELRLLRETGAVSHIGPGEVSITPAAMRMLRQ